MDGTVSEPVDHVAQSTAPAARADRFQANLLRVCATFGGFHPS
jgi:hypothetical protein